MNVSSNLSRNYFGILLYNRLVKSQLFVALCCTALSSFGMKSLNLVDFRLLVFIFSSTVLAYNLASYFHQKSKTLKYTVLFCGVLTLLSSFFLNWSLPFLIWLAILGSISLAYNIPFFSFRLRHIPFLKIGLISFVWASTASFLPLLNKQIPFSWSAGFLFLSLFCFVFGITLPFDIRDMKRDQYKIKTLPLFLGVKKTKQLAFSFLLMSAFFFSKRYSYSAPWEFLLSFWLSCLVAIGWILATHKKRKAPFFEIGIESCSLLPWLFLLLFSIGLDWL